MGRSWIKLEVYGYLYGSLRTQPITIQWLFTKFICLAGDQHCNGKIHVGVDEHGCGYSAEQLASIVGKPDLDIGISIPDNEYAYRLGKWRDWLAENDYIRVLDGGVIEVINFPRYQSEYDRQKQYRKGSGKPKKSGADRYLGGRYGRVVKH